MNSCQFCSLSSSSLGLSFSFSFHFAPSFSLSSVLQSEGLVVMVVAVAQTEQAEWE